MAKGEFWHMGDTMMFNNDLKVQRLEQPLIILMGNNTASAAEDFLVMLDQIPNRAITIGQKSYGSTGQPLILELPGGGKARICTKRDTYPDGREFVGYGIKPNIEVEKNIEDLINGKDTELELALKEFKKKSLVDKVKNDRMIE
jgi:C-terminal processing protease CtpA/Prc